MIRLDFEDTYALMECDEDYTNASFFAELENGDYCPMKMRFDHIDLELGFEIYNLSFGSVDNEGSINILAKMRHAHIGKLFSTIVLQILNFLTCHPGVTVGFDGSTEGRTYLYHRLFLSNIEYLHLRCETLGMDYYVRYLRTGGLELRQNGNLHLRPKIEPFSLKRKTTDLYRFYLIRSTEHMTSF